MDTWIDIGGKTKENLGWRFYYEDNIMPGEVIIHPNWLGYQPGLDFRTTAEELVTFYSALKLGAYRYDSMDTMNLHNLYVSLAGRVEDPNSIVYLNVRNKHEKEDADHMSVLLYAIEGFVDFIIKAKYTKMLEVGDSTTTLAAVGLTTIMRYADIAA